MDPTYFDTAISEYNYQHKGTQHSGDKVKHNKLIHVMKNNETGVSHTNIIYITSYSNSLLKQWEKNPPIMLFVTDTVVYYMILKMTL